MYWARLALVRILESMLRCVKKETSFPSKSRLVSVRFVASASASLAAPEDILFFWRLQSETVEAFKEQSIEGEIECLTHCHFWDVRVFLGATYLMLVS